MMEYFFHLSFETNFTVKVHERFFPVTFDKFLIFFKENLRGNAFVPFRLFWDFTSILKAITVFLLLHFDSYLAEVIMICLTKQMNIVSSHSFSHVFWYSLVEKSQNILSKMLAVELCFS